MSHNDGTDASVKGEEKVGLSYLSCPKDSKNVSGFLVKPCEVLTMKVL